MNLLDKKENYRLGGRYLCEGDIIYLSYSASYIEFAFHGTKANAVIISDGYDEEELMCGQIAVFLDDDDKPAKRVMIRKGRQIIELVNEECARDIKVRIMKYSETMFGDVGIEKIDIDGEVIMLGKSGKNLIEFVGDSITCGYGIEGENEKDVFTTFTENPWDNYAGLVSRMTDMDYQLISWSGNGIISHWLGEYSEKPRVENFFLQDLYPYADAELERKKGRKTYTEWNFDRKPEYIIINLGTNDSSYTRNIKERNEFFTDTYLRLINLIRSKNPDSKILCILGVMEQCLDKQVKQAVEKVNELGDKNVFFMKCELQRNEDGLAIDAHPSKVTHQKLATAVVDKIKMLDN